MEPFNVTELPSNAFTRYPTPLEFLKFVGAINAMELEGYLHQQVTEGIPFVFLPNPLLYEVVRTWLAKQLCVHAKDITLIGSARVGFSLAPAPDFGNPYNHGSDLDFTIVSSRLFDQLKETFNHWKREYENGLIKARGARETAYWQDHMARVPGNLKNGFIDTYKIPNIFDSSQRINDALWKLGAKLAATDSTFSNRKVSARVYSGWSEFSRQFMINYRHAVRNVNENHMKLLAIRQEINSIK